MKNFKFPATTALHLILTTCRAQHAAIFKSIERRRPLRGGRGKSDVDAFLNVERTKSKGNGAHHPPIDEPEIPSVLLSHSFEETPLVESK